MSSFRIRTLGLVAAFSAVGLLLYANALNAPFIYDDIPAVVENPDIRQLWPPAWMAPRDGAHAAVNARPLVALSLAANYALGALDPRGYRLFNLLVHVGNALLLYAAVRRTLALARPQAPAAGLGLACAALWLCHPLASQCVNYVIQRTELLMAFFYLATLYAGVRAMGGAGRWNGVAIAACALGMASKEVMVSAPLMVWCYDRTFVAGSFAAAWRQRRGLYGGLAATWAILALLAATQPHGNTVGPPWSAAAWQYALNQPALVLQYLKLAFWPHPLVLDYGLPRPLALADAWGGAAAVLALAVGAGYGFWRGGAGGFLGILFFAVLAPTSSVVPLLNEVGAERRVYLGLAALIALAVCGGYGLLRRRVGRPGLAGAAAAAGACLLLGYATTERNRDYQSELSIWRTVVQARPDNPRGHNNYGKAQYEAGMLDSARARYRRAVELKPKYAEAWGNLGLALFHLGDRDGAIRAYGQALAQDGRLAATWYNLGLAHHQRGDLRRAVQAYEKAVGIAPGDVEAWYNLGTAHRQAGVWGAARKAFARVNRLAPDWADGWLETGQVLRQMGDAAGAGRAFAKAAELLPAGAPKSESVAPSD